MFWGGKSLIRREKAHVCAKSPKSHQKHIQQTHQKSDNLLIIKHLMGFILCA